MAPNFWMIVYFLLKSIQRVLMWLLTNQANTENRIWAFFFAIFWSPPSVPTLTPSSFLCRGTKWVPAQPAEPRTAENIMETCSAEQNHLSHGKVDLQPHQSCSFFLHLFISVVSVSHLVVGPHPEATKAQLPLKVNCLKIRVTFPLRGKSLWLISAIYCYSQSNY